jgi:hypothetical protein
MCYLAPVADEQSDRWARTVSLAVAGWAALWALVLFPGEITPDTLDQYEQGLTGAFTNAHPPLLSVLLGLSGHAVGSPGGAFLLQMGFGAAAVASAAWLVPADRRSRVAFVLLAFCPLLWAQWFAIWKDTWMGVAYLGLLVALGTGRYALAVLAAAWMCGFRHNAVILVLPLAAWLTWASRPRGWAYGAAMVVAAVVLPRLLDRALDVKDVNPAAATLVFDVTGVYAREEEAFLSGPYAGDVDYAALKEAYDVRSARDIVSDRRGLPPLRLSDLAAEEPYAELEAEWSRVVRAWPGAWARHKAAFALCYVGLCHRNPFDPYGRTTEEALAFERTVGMESAPYVVVDKLRRRLARPLARGVFWLVPVVGIAALAARRQQGFDLAIASSALLYEAGNLAVAPSSPFRYHMPTLLVLLILLPRALDRR